MHGFHFTQGQLCCERIRLADLADKYGTPFFVYSQTTLSEHFGRLNDALAPLDRLICFAAKANSNLAVLSTFASHGSGFDIVSEGELRRVMAAGGDPAKCVFAGVAKTEAEIEFALRQGIYCFNVESPAELARINEVAGRLKRRAPVAARVNPNVDAHTHAKVTTGTYANKFGIALEQVERLYQQGAKLKHVYWRGIQMHIGSQLTLVTPFEEAVRKVAPLARTLAARHGLEFFSVGGGIGVVYQDALASGAKAWWQRPAAKSIITPELYAQRLLPLLQPLGLKILFEPGRFLVGNAGALVSRVEYIKQTGKKTFVIVDAAMNDLIRPAFYDSYHEIVPVRRKTGKSVSSDVVGGICESGDYFCKDRPLPALKQGDLIVLLTAGAYGSVMGSNYNSRPDVTEVLVKDDVADVVRERQKYEDIWRNERLARWQRGQ